MTTELAVHQPLSGEQLDLIKRTIAEGCTNDELAMFAQICQRTGLDPFARQIYAIKRKSNHKDGDQWVTEEKMTIQVSIDGARLIAERSGKYGGQVGPWWCGDDGVWKEVWLESAPPRAAKVGIIRTDWAEPIYAVARWESYAQVNTKDGKPIGLWGKMGDVMLAKCAESLGLRRAMPAELSGLYTSEEMAQADAIPSHIESQDDAHPKPSLAPSKRKVTRAELEARYQQLCDEAIDRGITDIKWYDPDWTDAILLDQGKRLSAAIDEAEGSQSELFDESRRAIAEPIGT